LKNINFVAKRRLPKELTVVKNLKTIFLDRDGTLNKEVQYLRRSEDFSFLPRTLEALKLLSGSGWQLICVTNQSGVARGIITESFLINLHSMIIRKLAEDGIILRDILYCPHHPEGTVEKYRKECSCRKPGTGLIDIAVKKHNADLSKSIIVGDKLSDILTGKNAKIKTVLVMTGYGKSEMKRGKAEGILPDFYFDDLFAFSRWLADNEDKIFST
jgi:D-glycero-D-manno-heptose 1,7-bisphosphate phosphatase